MSLNCPHKKAPATRAQVTIAIARRCPYCSAVVSLSRGLREVVNENPRSIWPGIFLLGVFSVTVACGSVLAFSINAVFGPTRNVSFICTATMFLFLPGLMLRYVPLRMLVCSRCRRVVKIALGRFIPLDWQEHIVPDWRCMRCAYSLIGVVENARCPECEQRFPRAWLKGTRLGVEDPEVEIK